MFGHIPNLPFPICQLPSHPLGELVRFFAVNGESYRSRHLSTKGVDENIVGRLVLAARIPPKHKYTK
jgi:hypothetical protein